jgi:hypothetical protein
VKSQQQKGPRWKKCRICEETRLTYIYTTVTRWLYVVYLCDKAEEAIVVWSEYEPLIIICHPTPRDLGQSEYPASCSMILPIPSSVFLSPTLPPALTRMQYLANIVALYE